MIFFMKKGKFASLLLAACCTIIMAFTFSSCHSSNPYVKAKGARAYKHTKTRQAKWGSTTSLETTYKIKNKKSRSSSVKKIKK